MRPSTAPPALKNQANMVSISSDLNKLAIKLKDMQADLKFMLDAKSKLVAETKGFVLKQKAYHLEIQTLKISHDKSYKESQKIRSKSSKLRENTTLIQSKIHNIQKETDIISGSCRKKTSQRKKLLSKTKEKEESIMKMKKLVVKLRKENSLQLKEKEKLVKENINVERRISQLRDKMNSTININKAMLDSVRNTVDSSELR